MLTEERFREILKLLEEKKAVTVAELTELLDSSESTIRRDLTVLNNKGQLNKVHGGATALDINYSTKDDDVAVRQDRNRNEKMRIAQYAAQLIEKNDFVFIDAGTSTELLIDFISEKKAVYVTNSMGHAKKLVQKGCTATILGGELKLATEAVVGAETIASLQKYNFTKGFFGTNGVNRQTGFSTPDLNEAMVKMQAMLHCKEKYVLADASKFNKVSSVTFGNFSDATILTDCLEGADYRSCKNIVEVDRV